MLNLIKDLDYQINRNEYIGARDGEILDIVRTVLRKKHPYYQRTIDRALLRLIGPHLTEAQRDALRELSKVFDAQCEETNRKISEAVRRLSDYVRQHDDRRKSLTEAKNEMKGAERMRILFLAANPTTTTPLDLEEELRSLELELQGVRNRDQIKLTARHAVRPDDLIRYVRAEQPTVIHFSGHGSNAGIVLRNDDTSSYTQVTGPALRRFLEGRGVELLVLNACYSKEQADQVGDTVKAVVGTTSAVNDQAARRFAIAFYRTLGNGLSIGEAFRDGGDAVELHGLKDVFWCHGELDLVPVSGK